MWWVSLFTWSPYWEVPSSTCWRPSWFSNWQQPGQCVGSTAGADKRRNCWTGLAGSLSANFHTVLTANKKLHLECPGRSISPYLTIILIRQEVQPRVWSDLGKHLLGLDHHSGIWLWHDIIVFHLRSELAVCSQARKTWNSGSGRTY